MKDEVIVLNCEIYGRIDFKINFYSGVDWEF